MASDSTPPESSAYLELAYSSINVFADDGTLDMGELNFLLGIALRDGQIDDDERRVLGNILKQALTVPLTPSVKSRIVEIQRKYSL